MSLPHPEVERAARWAPVYRACRLVEAGVSFQEFLNAPWAFLAQHGQEAYFRSHAAGYRPLLPRQAKIARRVRQVEMSRQHRRGNVLPLSFR